jgi:hypothetical protein
LASSEGLDRRCPAEHLRGSYRSLGIESQVETILAAVTVEVAAMRTPDIPERTPRRFDAVQAVCAVAVFAFLAVAGADFLRSWPVAEHGLLLFERACPIYTSPQHTS